MVYYHLLLLVLSYLSTIQGQESYVTRAIRNREPYLREMLNIQKVAAKPESRFFTVPYKVCRGGCKEGVLKVIPLLLGNRGRPALKKKINKQKSKLDDASLCNLTSLCQTLKNYQVTCSPEKKTSDHTQRLTQSTGYLGFKTTRTRPTRQNKQPYIVPTPSTWYPGYTTHENTERNNNDPTIPEQPDNPHDPDNPDDSKYPDSADYPKHPDNPDYPKYPDHPPDYPKHPDQPYDPDQSNYPDHPDNQNHPTKPDHEDNTDHGLHRKTPSTLYHQYNRLVSMRRTILERVFRKTKAFPQFDALRKTRRLIFSRFNAIAGRNDRKRLQSERYIDRRTTSVKFPVNTSWSRSPLRPTRPQNTNYADLKKKGLDELSPYGFMPVLPIPMT